MSTRALQVECLLTPLYDYRNGAICSAYTVYFYSAGTSTAKNVWTEKEKTNPYTSRTLGSNGTIQVYGDGVYKIVVKDGDGTAVYTWDNVKIQHPNVAVLSKSGTYTATVDDDYILVTTTAGNVTINLYAAALFTHPLCIKNIGANSVIIDPSGAELIEGAATYTNAVEDMATWLFSNGSTWYVANDAAANATDAINLVAAVAGAKKLTAHATTIDIETNNEYLRQLNAAGDGYVNIVKVNASDLLELEALTELHLTDTNSSHDLIIKAGSDLTADRIFSIITGDAARSLTTDQNIDLSTTAYPRFLGLNNGTYNIAIPTNGFGAASKFMMGDSNTIAWFYLNAAPPGWKVTATGADTVLAVSGGAGLYNVNGGIAGGESWANLKGHTHTGPSHTHAAGTLAGPNHTHTLANAANATSRDVASQDVACISGGVIVNFGPSGADSYPTPSTTTGNPSATAATGSTAAEGTGASGAQSTADVRPTASIGKLYQLDTA